MRRIAIIGLVVLILTGVILSCATKPNNTYHTTIFLNQRPYNFDIKVSKDHQVIATSVIQGSDIKIFQAKEIPEIFHAELNPEKDSWHLADYPEISIQAVTISPYYSFYSYRVLEALQETKLDVLYPSCPVETKFLVVFIVGKAGIPWAGCVL